MFRLMRYFAIASLFGFVVVTALLGYLYRQTAVNNLTELAEEKNVATTLGFANSLWPEVVPYIESTKYHAPASLISHPDIPSLHASVIEQVAGLSVVKVKIYNPSGLTVFSTELEQIGSSEENNAGFLAAWQGNVISELTHRDTFNAFDGVIEDQDVLATYMPIRSEGRTGDIVGVIELYSNITPLLQRVNTVRRNVVLGVAGILASLYVVLVLLVHNADRIIRTQQLERDQAQRELRQQHRSLATFKERERLARELHDSLGQVLGFVKMQSQAALELYEQNRTQEGFSHLQRLIDTVQNAHVDVREYILNLQSGVPEDQDFVGALESHLEKFSRFSDVRARLRTPSPTFTPDLHPHAEAQLLRITQEALTNIRKHANAQQATITLGENEHETHITIADDGNGFELENIPPPNGHHVGLQIMRERAAEIGGRVEVRTAPNRGTEIFVAVSKSDECREGALSHLLDRECPSVANGSTLGDSPLGDTPLEVFLVDRTTAQRATAQPDRNGQS